MTRRRTKPPAAYRVVSDLVVGHNRGDLVTAADLPDANLEALIVSAHLEPADPATTEEE